MQFGVTSNNSSLLEAADWWVLVLLSTADTGEPCSGGGVSAGLVLVITTIVRFCCCSNNGEIELDARCTGKREGAAWLVETGRDRDFAPALTASRRTTFLRSRLAAAAERQLGIIFPLVKLNNRRRDSSEKLINGFTASNITGQLLLFSLSCAAVIYESVLLRYSRNNNKRCE